jgi:nucleotide-binding universal stress UspA family protein
MTGQRRLKGGTARTGRAQERASYHRILWPADFSGVGRAVLPHLAALASREETEVVILHVFTPPALYALPPETGTVWIRLEKEARAAAREQLERLERQLTKSGIRTRTVLVDGTPAPQIARVARRLRCDLIVLATHGHTGFIHALLGSVAENVVRHAPCPVLTVRPPRFQHAR